MFPRSGRAFALSPAMMATALLLGCGAENMEDEEEVGSTSSALVLSLTEAVAPAPSLIVDVEQGQLVPIDVRAGDRVLFAKWSGTEVKIEGEEYLIMKESDLLGVVEKTGALRKAA